MRKLLVAALVGCLTMGIGAAQAATLLDTTYTWSADGSEANQTGRLVRNAVQSTWASPKANPGLISSDLQDFVAFNIAGGIFDHFQVTVFQLTSHNIYGAAYSSYNPGDPTQNYLADSGRSSGLPPETRSFQFILAPGSDFDIALSTVNGLGDAANGQTRLLVEGFVGEPSETPLPAAAWLFGTGLAGLAMVRRRARRKSAAAA